MTDRAGGVRGPSCVTMGKLLWTTLSGLAITLILTGCFAPPSCGPITGAPPHSRYHPVPTRPVFGPRVPQDDLGAMPAPWLTPSLDASIGGDRLLLPLPLPDVDKESSRRSPSNGGMHPAEPPLLPRASAQPLRKD